LLYCLVFYLNNSFRVQTISCPRRLCRSAWARFSSRSVCLSVYLSVCLSTA